jgi:hypothetical protein
VQERGTTITVSGKTLTFAWDPNVGLATKDPLDTFSTVRWNVANVQIQPVGKSAQKQFVSTFYPNASFINCL